MELDYNQKKRFNEDRARLILMELFPDRYDGTQLSESPDIQCLDTGIGIEVTSCNKQEIKKRMSLMTAIYGKQESELSWQEKKRITEQDIIIDILPNGSILPMFSYWGDGYSIETVLEKKLDKLSGHYKQFSENELFVFAWMCDDDELHRIIDDILRINTPATPNFDKVYLCRDRNLYVEIVAVSKSSVETFEITKDRMQFINNTALMSIVSKN